MKRIIRFALTLTLLLLPSLAGSQPASTNASPIVVFVLENRDLSEVQNEPYLSAFAAGGELFTNYFAITHPSLPNYIAMTSGSTGPYIGNAGKPKSDSDDNIFHQVGSSGWTLYAETMTTNCQFKDAKPYYLRRHNPPPYYSDITGRGLPCATNDVPLPADPTVAPPLAPLTYVIPNNCDNMHGTGRTGICPGNTQAIIDAGDTWLAQHVPAYLAAGATVIITFDVGDDDNPASTNNVYTAIQGPGTAAGQTDATYYDHYNLLAGLEDNFGVDRLGNAVGATPLPIT